MYNNAVNIIVRQVEILPKVHPGWSGLLNNLLCVCVQGLFVCIFEVRMYICVHLK